MCFTNFMQWARRRDRNTATWRSDALAASPTKEMHYAYCRHRRCRHRLARRGIADATGKIKNVDMNKDMIKLDNGSSYIVPKSVKLSDFKVREKVTVIYNKTGDNFAVPSVKPPP